MKILITPKDNKGAILIISIIIGVVALAAGLTASNFVSRSTRNITDQESSIKALAIAESGVEKVLGLSDVSTYSSKCFLTQVTKDKESDLPKFGSAFVSSGNIPANLTSLLSSPQKDCFYQEDLNGDSVPDQSYYLEVTSKGGAGNYTMDSIDKDSVLEINTDASPSLAGKKINIAWIDEATKYASLLISEIYLDAGTYKVKKYAYNPDDSHDDDTTGQSSNGFSDGTFTSPKIISPDIILSTGTKIIRIKPLYFKANSIIVTLDGGAKFPTENQGFDIYSTGCTCENVLDASSRQNSSVRKVKVSKSREHLPAIFDYVLYSGSETVPLTK